MTRLVARKRVTAHRRTGRKLRAYVRFIVPTATGASTSPIALTFFDRLRFRDDHLLCVGPFLSQRRRCQADSHASSG